MQIMPGKVDNTPAVHVRDIGLTDDPFLRRFPIIKRSAGWNLMNRQRQMVPDDGKRFTHAITGETAADWIEAGSKIVDGHPVRQRRNGNFNALVPGPRIHHAVARSGCGASSARRRSASKTPSAISLRICAMRWKRGPSNSSSVSVERL